MANLEVHDDAMWASTVADAEETSSKSIEAPSNQLLMKLMEYR
jgi:hypothetical protein